MRERDKDRDRDDREKCLSRFLCLQCVLTKIGTSPGFISFPLSDCSRNGVLEKWNDLPRLWGSGRVIQLQIDHLSWSLFFLELRAALRLTPSYSSPPASPQSGDLFPIWLFHRATSIVLETKQAAPVSDKT